MDGLSMGILLGLLSNLFLSIQNVAVKSQGNVTHPIYANSIKIWVSFLFMTTIVIIPFRTQILFIPIDAVVLLIISVVLGGTVGDIIYFIGQERVGVSVAFPIAMTFPVFTYILAMVFFGEAFLLSKLLGIIMAVSGIIVISRKQAPKHNQLSLRNSLDVVGIALALLTALSYAVATIDMEIGLIDVDPIDAGLLAVG